MNIAKTYVSSEENGNILSNPISWQYFYNIILEPEYYYKNAKIKIIKQDKEEEIIISPGTTLSYKDIFGDTYKEILLVDNAQITIYGNGEWSEINA